MSEWGVRTFGEPCHGCGHRWDRSTSSAVALIADVPRAYRQLTSGASGRESAPDLDWNVVAYVAHVADNLRIWAERLAAFTQDGSLEIVGYDDDLLAVARNYRELPLSGALWSLGQSVDGWLTAVAAAPSGALVHPERGRITVAEIAATNAHDAAHHHADIGRCLAAAGRPGPPPTLPGSTSPPAGSPRP